MFKKKKKEDKKVKKKDFRKVLEESFLLAGFERYQQQRFFRTFKRLFIYAAIIIFLVFIYLAIKSGDFLWLIISLFTLYPLIMFLLLFTSFGFVMIFLDLLAMNRKGSVEAYFPDFLLLTASNINAGLPIEQAMWLAIRPEFGPLAKDMEIVAKKTMSGEPLEKALREFAEKYDSKIIKRSIHLIIEGIRSGGKISDLLVKIAHDLEEARILSREMSASITTYLIFIIASSVLIAPVLFALATDLLTLMSQIIGSLDLSNMSGGPGLMINVSGQSINPHDFMIFSFVMLFLSSLFTSFMVSAIRKGSILQGLKQFPFYLIVSYLIYLIVKAFFLGFMAEMI